MPNISRGWWDKPVHCKQCGQRIEDPHAKILICVGCQQKKTLLRTNVKIPKEMITLFEISHYPHEEHNPSCDITYGYYKDENGHKVMVSYYQYIPGKPKEWGVEIYRGPNYILESLQRNGSRNYRRGNNLPKKYDFALSQLRKEFFKHYKIQTYQ